MAKRTIMGVKLDLKPNMFDDMEYLEQLAGTSCSSPSSSCVLQAGIPRRRLRSMTRSETSRAVYPLRRPQSSS